MKQTITKYQFSEAFRNADRKENFSIAGLDALFNYFEQIEEDTGEEMELDVIAICCEYSEATPEEIAANYSIDISDCEDDESIKETVIDYLNDNTEVVGEVADSILYAQF